MKGFQATERGPSAEIAPWLQSDFRTRRSDTLGAIPVQLCTKLIIQCWYFALRAWRLLIEVCRRCQRQHEVQVSARSKFCYRGITPPSNFRPFVATSFLNGFHRIRTQTIKMSLNTTVQTPSDPSAAVSGSAGQLEASQKDGLSPMTDMSSTSPAIDQTLSKPTETRIGEEIPLNEVATPAQAAADSDKASGTTETDVATRKEDDNDTVVKVEDQTPKVPAPPPMDYPDDNHFGFGWLVVFANFMILFLVSCTWRARPFRSLGSKTFAH